MIEWILIAVFGAIALFVSFGTGRFFGHFEMWFYLNHKLTPHALTNTKWARVKRRVMQLQKAQEAPHDAQ